MATRSRKTADSDRAAGEVQGEPCVALVLQGGGALGAYHIGAYEALSASGFEPDWISGISIGAINAALLAGNRADTRLERMQALWEHISRPDFVPATWQAQAPLPLRRAANTMSSMQAIVSGQPNFFFPRIPSPQFLPTVPVGRASYYDTSPMLETLATFVDFDRINAGEVRLSLGATDVERGDLVFFNNWERKIGPEHVLASGSLPPGFPATEVEGRWYWDGGCVSNTPLEAILQQMPDRPLLVFMVDLWSASGPLPDSMDDVAWRQKQIQYASRTSHHIRRVSDTLNLARRLADAGVKDDAAIVDAPYLQYRHRLDIVHITYNPADDQISTSDAEFSRASIAERRAAGLRDMRAVLRRSPWAEPSRPACAAAVHRVRHGEVTAAGR